MYWTKEVVIQIRGVEGNKTHLLEINFVHFCANALLDGRGLPRGDNFLFSTKENYKFVVPLCK